MARNGSQLGGVNVRVLGLFSNSFPHSQNRPFVTFRQYDLIPFTLPYRRKGGNNTHPHSSHCMLWYTSKHLPTLFCSNPFTQSHVVKYSSCMLSFCSALSPSSALCPPVALSSLPRAPPVQISPGTLPSSIFCAVCRPSSLL